jgi:hypothetical protein
MAVGGAWHGIRNPARGNCEPFAKTLHGNGYSTACFG